METKLRKITDGHYCWTDKRVLNLINGFYGKSSKKRRTARSVYLSLAEVSSDNNNLAYFNCSRALVAFKSAVSPSTADRYLSDFIRIGILGKTNRKNNKENLINVWYMLPFPSVLYLGHTLRDDKSHYGYNKGERFSYNKGEVMNKHLIEEKNSNDITNVPNVPVRGIPNSANVSNVANVAPNVTNVTHKEGEI